MKFVVYYRTERHMAKSLERTQPLSVLDRRYLFYGTGNMEDVRRICTHNFDESASAERDTKYGSGVCFSRDATFSDIFTEGPTGFMFLADVLVGQFARGERGYRRPPPLTGLRADQHDSCVNTLYNPNIFRVFEKNQYYPAYLIKCTDNRGFINMVYKRTHTK